MGDRNITMKKLATKKLCRGIDHIHINVADVSVSGPFYNKLLKHFGFSTLDKSRDYWWWHSKGENTFGIEQTSKKYLKIQFHRKQTGLNHIAFRASSREDIDEFYNKFLLHYKIPVLYGGPKNYPEYHKSYYAVFFEDPDRVKLEFMWIEE